MKDRSTDHETFVIERTYDAAPSRVFAAWASRESKARWFGAPDGENLNLKLGSGFRLRLPAVEP